MLGWFCAEQPPPVQHTQQVVVGSKAGRAWDLVGSSWGLVDPGGA